MTASRVLATSTLLLALAACGSPGKYIETGGTDSIVSVGEVDIQDLQTAASGMLESLVAQGVLSTAPHKPARLRIERVVNDTSSAFDVGELTYRMREQLVNSGQATVLTAYGADAESPEAQERLKQEAFRQGQTTVDSLQPDFFLTGKITQLKRSAGSTKQVTYTFRLTLTDSRTGQEAWTKVVDVTKQGTKNAVGY